MAESEPRETRNLDIYGNETLPWSRARTAVEQANNGPDVAWFLGVTEPDGSPHAAGVEHSGWRGISTL